MYQKIIAVIALTLYSLLAFLASVATDFYDRYYPQSVGIASQMVVDFAQSSLDREGALAELQRLDEEHHLNAFKLLPDLDDTGAQVLVDLTPGGRSGEVDWFGEYENARIVGVERLENSAVSGTYLIGDASALGPAVAELNAQGVTVDRSDGSPLRSVLLLTQEPGFLAPVIAACALVAGMTVFWLAIRARSRALRVLAGTAPLRIQLQDLGRFIATLAMSAIVIAALSSLVVALTRGWVFVPSYLAIVSIFESVTLVASLFAAFALSSASWPNTELFARRTPAVSSLRWTARVVQALTLLALIAFVGPTWAASVNAAQTARQLEAWNELSDQVQLTFGMQDKDLDLVAPQVARLVNEAEKTGSAALSYAINEDSWQGDFGPYTSIALVNDRWIELVGNSVGKEALVEVDTKEVAEILERELSPSLELWGADLPTGQADLATLAVFEPSPGIAYPVAQGGVPGELTFASDVLIVKVSAVADVFNARNTVSLASTGNIMFSGADSTRELLLSAGLDEPGLESVGVEGAIGTQYLAERGILESQFATYLAQLLAISTVALAAAFIVSAVVNAMIAGLLNARRDFPLRIAGSTWERVVRSRALRDVAVGVVIAAIVVTVQPVQTMAVTFVVASLAVCALYASHLIAAPVIFSRIIQRKL